MQILGYEFRTRRQRTLVKTVISAEGLKNVCDFCRRIEDFVWFLLTDWRMCVISADGLKTVCDFCRLIEDCVWFMQTDWRLCVISADGLKNVCDFCRLIEDCVWFMQTDWGLCVIPVDWLKNVCDSCRRIEDCVRSLQTDWGLCMIPTDGLKLKFLKWKRPDGCQLFAPKSHSFSSQHQHLIYHCYDCAKIFPKSGCSRESFVAMYRHKVPKPFASRGYRSA